MKFLILLTVLAFFNISILNSQEQNEITPNNDFSSDHLKIGYGFFEGFTISNSIEKFTIGMFGMTQELEQTLIQSKNVESIIKNVNANFTAGSIISFTFSCVAGFLLGKSTAQDDKNSRYVYLLSGLGSLLLGEIIGNVFYNAGYNDLSLAVEKYNSNLLK